MSDYFVTLGGGLNSKHPAFIERNIVTQILTHINKDDGGDFCYALTPRQMGKTTLKNVLVEKLQNLEDERGFYPVVIDLDLIGRPLGHEDTPKEKRVSKPANVASPNNFYFGIADKITQDLKLQVNLQNWWTAESDIGLVNRFTKFLHNVVLEEISSGSVVIFIDEIGLTRSLSFDTDDFFAAIRAVYNARGDDPIFERLTFVLFGTAAPNDLIKDPDRTPFNLGYRIDLQEFSLEEVCKWQQYLEKRFPGYGREILVAVFEWTNGHPELSQRLCGKLDEITDRSWSGTEVHEWMEKSVLPEIAKDIKNDWNLLSIQREIERLPDNECRKILELYRRIRKTYGDQRSEELVKSDDKALDYEIETLKIIGLVREKDGVLQVRNKIYYSIFDDSWIEKHTPAKKGSRLAFSLLTIIFILIGLLAYNFFIRQPKLEAQAQGQVYVENFQENTSPDIRLNSLEGLFQLGRRYPIYNALAIQLFSKLTPEDQVRLFVPINPKNVETSLIITVQALYTTFEDNEQNNRILRAMSSSLIKLDEPIARNIATEIDRWLIGREHFAHSEFTQAEEAYNVAISLNDSNPLTHYERALVLVALSDYEAALLDFDQAIQFNESLSTDIRQEIISNKELYDYFTANSDNLVSLINIVPTPTPIPTNTFTPTPINTSTPIPTNTLTPSPINASTPIPTNASTPTLISTSIPITSSTLRLFTPVSELESTLQNLVRAERTASQEYFRTLDKTGLDTVYTDPALGFYQEWITGLQNLNIYYDITLHRIDFLGTCMKSDDVALLIAELIESRKTCSVGTQQCFAERPNEQYRIGYRFDKIDGQWLISAMAYEDKFWKSVTEGICN